MLDALQMHYETVASAIAAGEVIPFFGAGVNMCGRPPGAQWQRDGAQFLPSGGELSAYLAQSFNYTQADANNLLRVSQYVSLTRGSGPLYKALRKLFNADYPPTPLHGFFAGLPAALRAKGYDPTPYQLIVTTNYDDLMERAYFAARVPFDLVSYVAEGQNRGKFWHWTYAPAEGQPADDFWGQAWPPPVAARLIERPNEYKGITLDEDDYLLRPVILKIHGAVDRAAAENDSYVITEDHYIEYLTRADISSLVPATLVAKLKGSSFLFLGYSLQDWNLRVILQRIWGEAKLTYSSWAVQLNPPDLDKRFWNKRNVEILNISLDEYVAGLERQLAALPSPGGDA